MLTTPIDNMNFKNDQEIKAMLGHEDIYFSDKIIKVRQGIFSSNQERVILITDQALYNLKGKEKKKTYRNRKFKWGYNLKTFRPICYSREKRRI